MKPKIDDFVHIIFWDHAENFHDAMQFEVVGKVCLVTPKAYIVKCWFYHDEAQRAEDHNADQNEHRFAIVKSAIESIEIL